MSKLFKWAEVNSTCLDLEYIPDLAQVQNMWTTHKRRHNGLTWPGMSLVNQNVYQGFAANLFTGPVIQLHHSGFLLIFILVWGGKITATCVPQLQWGARGCEKFPIFWGKWRTTHTGRSGKYSRFLGWSSCSQPTARCYLGRCQTVP